MTKPCPRARDRADEARLLGLRLSTLTQDEALARIDRAMATGEPISVTFLNPNYVIAAWRDPRLKELINTFDLILPDGWGVVYAARFLGIEIADRIAGDDISPDLFRLAESHGWRTFLFGSEPGVAEQARRTINRLLPALPVCGVRHGWWDVVRGHPGWYEPDDEVAAVTAVNEAEADLVVVGLPTPLQQRWVTSHRAAIKATVVITVGAYLDHLNDALGYYPQWALRFRLCWLYKWSLEPRRLWRRYTIELVQFSALVMRSRLAMMRGRRWPEW